MALTHEKVSISNPADIKKNAKLKFLIDSGALYSVVPASILKKLDIEPEETREFILANGKSIARRLGGARFVYKGYRGYAPVIFGQKGDSTLLGITTLESMGLGLDPIKRKLISLPMVLG